MKYGLKDLFEMLFIPVTKKAWTHTLNEKVDKYWVEKIKFVISKFTVPIDGFIHLWQETSTTPECEKYPGNTKNTA